MAEFGSGFRVYADASEFERGMARVSSAAQNAGDRVAKAFDAGSIAKGFLGGLGIGSALAVIDKLSTAIRGAIQHAENLAQVFDSIGKNARSALGEIAKVGKTEEQLAEMSAKRLDALKAKRDALLNDTGNKSFFGGLIGRGSAADKLFGFSREDDEKRAEKIKDLNKEIGDTVVEVAKKTEEQRKKTAAAAGKDNAALAKQEQEGAKELLALKKKQADVEEKIRVETEAAAKAEAAVTAAVEDQVKEKEKFFAITSTGRGDKDLSDRELARKIETTRKDIDQRKIASPFQPDFFLSPQKLNLSQALAEQSLRQRLRSEVASFGEDRAFAMNPGVSERRFREIISGMQNDTRRQTDALEEMRRLMKSGLPVVNLNPGG